MVEPWWTRPDVSSQFSMLVIRRRSLSTLRGQSRLADLVLIRHGESEGNVARKRSLGGDHSLFSGEFKHRHSARWRLTDRGREQAIAAGEWLQRENLVEFDRYYERSIKAFNESIY